MPTQLTYCVTFIGYQYISGWCSRRRHCTCYRSCRFGQPAYIPLASYIPARHLRSSNSDRLNEPPARIAIGERRFSHYAPRIWNSLPTTGRSADSYDSFKARLKTHPFDTVWRWKTKRNGFWFWIFINRNGHVKIFNCLIDCAVFGWKKHHRIVPACGRKRRKGVIPPFSHGDEVL